MTAGRKITERKISWGVTGCRARKMTARLGRKSRKIQRDAGVRQNEGGGAAKWTVACVTSYAFPEHVQGQRHGRHARQKGVTAHQRTHHGTTSGGRRGHHQRDGHAQQQVTLWAMLSRSDVTPLWQLGPPTLAQALLAYSPLPSLGPAYCKRTAASNACTHD